MYGRNCDTVGAVFCPYWSGVVGLTTNKPAFITIQGEFTTTSKEKLLKCYKFNHHFAHPGQNYVGER